MHGWYFKPDFTVIFCVEQMLRVILHDCPSRVKSCKSCPSWAWGSAGSWPEKFWASVLILSKKFLSKKYFLSLGKKFWAKIFLEPEQKFCSYENRYQIDLKRFYFGPDQINVCCEGLAVICTQYGTMYTRAAFDLSRPDSCNFLSTNCRHTFIQEDILRC